MAEISDRTADFMLEEYKQIANAYQDLHAQQNELVKSYLTVVAVPASILTIGVQLLGIQSVDTTVLLGAVATVGMPILLSLLTILCLLGLAVVLAMVAIRAEALLYVRTVNCVRRYFVEQDPTARLKRYLVLPDFDTLPPFWEGWKSRSTWNVVIVELLNSVIFCVTIFSWGQLLGSEGWILPAIGALLWLACQYCLHRIMLSRSEKNYEEVYKVKFTEPFCPSDKKKVIGVDLDGVLNDLAGAVIEVAQSRFRLTIDRADIVSHRLQECTDLTSNQVEEIFASSDVFQIAKPVKGAKEALAQLRSTGWVIHVVTDRFWGTNDWTVARDWLVEHGFDWDHLNLIHAEEKAAYAETFGITVFIEDNYSTAVDLSSVCERVYLTDRTYNKGDLPEKACRVTDWQQVLDDLG